MLITVVVGILFLLIGRYLSINRVKNILSKGTGRFGIIKYNQGFSLCIFIEVEEVESAGDYTKVIIGNVISGYDNDQSRKELLKTWNGNEWVETKTITWYTNNSQKIRDSKIEQILNK